MNRLRPITDRNPWPLLTGACVAFWLLLPCSLASAQDTTTGKVFDWDLFVNGNDTGGSSASNLTTVGSPVFSGERVSSFSDSNYLTISAAAAAAALNGETSYTVSLWVNAASRTSNPAAFSMGGGTGSNSVLIYPFNSVTNSATIYANGAARVSAATNYPALSVDSHIALVVVSASQAIVYVDAVDRGQSATTCVLPATITNGVLGRWYAATGQAFNGSLGQVKIFNRPLSQSDITALRAEDVAELSAFRSPPRSTVPAVLLQLSN